MDGKSPKGRELDALALHWRMTVGSARSALRTDSEAKLSSVYWRP